MEEPRVIYEDKDFIALDKPAGLLVHGTSVTNRDVRGPTVVTWLLKHYPEVRDVGDPVHPATAGHGASDPVRPGIVHRLDRDTSGVLLVARTQTSFEYLKSLFKNRTIKKIYFALVWGKVSPSDGTVRTEIGYAASGGMKRSLRPARGGREAVTHYHVIRFGTFQGEDVSFLEVRPETGRTHQIRAHLNGLGHPVVGDLLYGRRRSNNGTRLMLHAFSLEFSPAPAKVIRVEADLPDEFRPYSK